MRAPRGIVHLNAPLHRRVREFCDLRGLTIQHWVESLLNAALDNDVRDPTVVKIVDKVPYRPLQELDDTDDDAWNRPPFWTRS